jgi:hypothetical protein
MADVLNEREVALILTVLRLMVRKPDANPHGVQQMFESAMNEVREFHHNPEYRSLR